MIRLMYNHSMMLVERQSGSRRRGNPVEFPLMDSQGVLVTEDRRRLPSRRKAGCDIDVIDVMLFKKGVGVTGRKGTITRRKRLTAIALIVAINAVFILVAYWLFVTATN